ncbi:conserved hypothetical protein [Tenacibaculum amylolyticum]
MENYKKHITLFYLVLFIGIKLVGLHILTHNDDHYDDCEICEYVITSNKTHISTENFVSFEQQFFHDYNEQSFSTYSYAFITKYEHNELFSRPPPAICM